MTSNGFQMEAVAQGPYTWSQPMREMGAAFADKKETNVEELTEPYLYLMLGFYTLSIMKILCIVWGD